MSAQEAFKKLHEQLRQTIIGQEQLVTRLLIALLADGHLLVEGTPGLAKTTAIKSLATGLEGNFHRIQFTPDLLPADLTGTEIYRPQDGSFQFQPGPIFHNLILADEINRAPAKVQAALLEAMAERQVTIGRKTYPLPPLFLVMATQNPIEHEGTYSLPEAQLDRFLMYVRVGYPDAKAEQQILQLARQQAKADNSAHPAPLQATVTQHDIMTARQAVLQLHLADSLEQYIVQLVIATRNPPNSNLAAWIRFGASPRATIALDRCARAHAWLQGRDYVSPQDIHAVAADVLRHRILLTYEAEADAITSDKIVQDILALIPVP